MPLLESFLILLLGAATWYWLDALKARETGVRAARAACREEGVQLLDETVAGRFGGFGRDDGGQLKIRRHYAFEYSDTGDNRCPGEITLLGQEIEWLRLRPRLYVVPAPSSSRSDTEI